MHAYLGSIPFDIGGAAGLRSGTEESGLFCYRQLKLCELWVAVHCGPGVMAKQLISRFMLPLSVC